MSSFINLSEQRRLPSDLAQLWFDAAHSHFVAIANNFFVRIPLAENLVRDSVQPNFSRCTASELLPCTIDPQSVLIAKLSLDKTLLAVCFKDKSVIVIELATKREWSITLKSLDQNELMGDDFILWSEHGGSSQDLILLGSKGFEFYKISAKRGQCKLSRVVNHKATHVWYEPCHRVMVTASGDMNSELRAYFLKFDAGDLPRIELPPPDKSPRFGLPVAAHLQYKDATVVNLYGQPYFVWVDVAAAKLRLFRLAKQGIAPSHTCAMYVASSACFSVTDELLVAHCQDAHISLFYDLQATPTLVDPIDGIENHDPFSGGCTIMFANSCVVAADDGESLTVMDDETNATKVRATILVVVCIYALLTLHTVALVRKMTSHQQRHATQAYSAPFKMLAPNWIYNPDDGFVWRIVCNRDSVLSASHEPHKILPFLLRRGQIPRIPRPAITLPRDDGAPCKALALHKFRELLTERASVTLLEEYYDALIAPYVHVLKEARFASGMTLSSQRMLGDSGEPVVEHFDRPERMKKSFSWNGQDPALSSSKRDLSVPFEASVHAVDVEPKNSLSTFVEHLTAVSGRIRTPSDPMPPGMHVAGRGGVISSLEASIPLTNRRTSNGYLVISQAEMLAYGWMPVVITEASDLEYVADALLGYINTLRAAEIRVVPAVTLLLFHLMVRINRVGEIARLMQNQAIPDSSDLARAVLMISDTLEPDMQELPQFRATTISNLRQAALDMLWRCDEKSSVVRWLLMQGLVSEAINLCMKHREQWPRGLNPSTISGIEFFRAAVLAVRKSTKPGQLYDKGAGLMFKVYKFLREWDTSLISASQSTNFSPLVREVMLPEELFAENDLQYIRQMFGYEGPTQGATSLFTGAI